MENTAKKQKKQNQEGSFQSDFLKYGNAAIVIRPESIIAQASSGHLKYLHFLQTLAFFGTLIKAPDGVYYIGDIYPSSERLIAVSGIPDRTLKRYYKECLERGLLEITRTFELPGLRPGTFNKKNVYRLHQGGLFELQISTGKPGYSNNPDINSHRVPTRASTGCQSGPATGCQSGPLPKRLLTDKPGVNPVGHLIIEGEDAGAENWEIEKTPSQSQRQIPGWLQEKLASASPPPDAPISDETINLVEGTTKLVKTDEERAPAIFEAHEDQAHLTAVYTLIKGYEIQYNRPGIDRPIVSPEICLQNYDNLPGYLRQQPEWIQVIIAATPSLDAEYYWPDRDAVMPAERIWSKAQLVTAQFMPQFEDWIREAYNHSARLGKVIEKNRSPKFLDLWDYASRSELGGMGMITEGIRFLSHHSNRLDGWYARQYQQEMDQQTALALSVLLWSPTRLLMVPIQQMKAGSNFHLTSEGTPRTNRYRKPSNQ